MESRGKLVQGTGLRGVETCDKNNLQTCDEVFLGHVSYSKDKLGKAQGEKGNGQEVALRAINRGNTHLIHPATETSTTK